MERVRGTGGRAVKTTVEQTLMRGLVTAVPCVRPGLPRSASGRRRWSSATQFTTRVPLRGPAPGPAQAQMSVQVDQTLRGTEVFDLRGRARVNRMTDGPQEGSHLPRNGGGDHG